MTMMRRQSARLVVEFTLALGVALLLARSHAYALASFSRQTGWACSACHTTFPELTPTGRAFKLHGYTVPAEETIEDNSDWRNPGLALLKFLPLSASFRASATMTDKRQPNAQDPSFEFPQQANLWFAGHITSHFGTYIQMTYSENAPPGADHFTLDNSDVRYADQTELAGKDLVWGIDANNNPTFEDLWNSTPGYGFPYVTPDSAGFAPAFTTLIDGALSRQVIGLGAYGMWDDHLYGLFELYRTQHVGSPQPETGVGNHNIRGVAPYWRLAWQDNLDKDDYVEVGTYGIYMDSHVNGVGGPTDNYTDVAADASYERSLASGDLIVLHSTFIYETNDLGASVAATSATKAHHNLETFRLDASYHYGHRFTLTAGPFITTGTHDSLLFPTGAVTGSAKGSPETVGYILQGAVWPWQNVAIGAQYRGFTTFNGSGSNYDGAGRDASDNNTFYVFVFVNV